MTRHKREIKDTDREINRQTDRQTDTHKQTYLYDVIDVKGISVFLLKSGCVEGSLKTKD
jgi:hypothetical protein